MNLQTNKKRKPVEGSGSQGFVSGNTKRKRSVYQKKKNARIMYKASVITIIIYGTRAGVQSRTSFLTKSTNSISLVAPNSLMPLTILSEAALNSFSIDSSKGKISYSFTSGEASHRPMLFWASEMGENILNRKIISRC